MRKCRIGTAKFFTLLLLLYRTSVNGQELKRTTRELSEQERIEHADILGVK